MSTNSNYKQAAQVLLDSGYSCYLVGGAVRDIMLGIEPDDYDLATNATPDETIAAFQRVGIDTHPTGIDHGTITVVFSGEPIEITTFRTEGDYTDGRRPDSVSFVADIIPDLARRDFTINAMAINLADGSLTDPFGGRDDLDAGVIRAVGNAQDRLLEDGLRAYRACRQAAKFNFEIDDELLLALRETEIAQPAIERINTEFTKGILYEKPSIMLNYLSVTGLLYNIIDTYPEDIITVGSKLDQAEPNLEVRLAIFLEPVKERAATIMEKLCYSNKIKDKVLLYLENYTNYHDHTKLLQNVGRENAEDVLEIYRIEMEEDDYKDIQRGIQYVLDSSTPLYVKDLEVDGSDVMALGVPQGRLVGIVLNTLLERVMEDPTLDQQAELRDIVTQME